MELDRMYNNRFSDDTWKQRDTMWKVLCREFFDRYVNQTDDVLDIAAGYCDFINNAAIGDNEKIGRRIAVDLNPDVKLHAGSHVEVHNCNAKDLGFLEDSSIDIVFVSNFFEHIRDKEDIIAILRECLRVLKIGGRILILQPNINCLGGKYWDFFDHYTPLNENSMQEALELCHADDPESGKPVSFRIRRLIKRFLPYTTKSRIPQKAWMIKLYCHCPLAWKIMGKQLFIAAEKVPEK